MGPAAGTFRTLLETEAAVVAAQPGQPAVVGSDGVTYPVVITNAQIRNLKTVQAYRTNNCALKWIRAKLGEHLVPGQPEGPIEITGQDVILIEQSVKVHDGADNGMDYGWQEGVTTPWSWRQCLAGLPIDKL